MKIHITMTIKYFCNCIIVHLGLGKVSSLSVSRGSGPSEVSGVKVEVVLLVSVSSQQIRDLSLSHMIQVHTIDKNMCVYILYICLFVRVQTQMCITFHMCSIVVHQNTHITS